MFFKKMYKQTVFLIGFLFFSFDLVAASWWGSVWQGSKKIVGNLSQVVVPDQSYDALKTIKSEAVVLHNAEKYKEQEAEMIVAVEDLKKRYPENSTLSKTQLIELLKSVDDETGNTIAHYAAKKMSPVLINFLVERGLVALFFQKNNQQVIPFVLLMEAYSELELLEYSLSTYVKDSINSLHSIVSDIGIEKFSQILDEQNNYLFYRAIVINNATLVQVLLQAGVRPFISQGKNPLALAVQKENIEIIKLLLKQDLAKDLIVATDEILQKTSFEVAMENKNVEIGYLLLEKEGVLESLLDKMKQLSKNESQKSRSLNDVLQHGLISQDEYNQFLKNIGLVYLNNSKAKNVIKKLEEAKILSFESESDGSSALFTAVQNNALEEVKNILPHCSIETVLRLNMATNLSNELQGLSPLHLAAYNNFVEILKVLLQKEGVMARSHVKNSQGENFMHILVKNFYKNMTDTSMNVKQFFSEKAYNFFNNQEYQLIIRASLHEQNLKYLVDKTLINEDEVSNVQQTMLEYLQVIEAKAQE